MKINRKLLSLLIFCMCLPTISFALAMLTPQKLDEPKLENALKPLGYFIVELKVENAINVYAWQAVIEFNPEKIIPIEVVPGNFLDETGVDKNSYHQSNHGYRAAETSIFAYHVVDQQKLIVGQSLLGEQYGESGNGTLAYIKFAYLTEDYQNAYSLVFNDSCYKTLLMNSKLLPTNGQIALG